MRRLACFVLLAASVHAADSVDASTLEGKVLFGYQGWFGCPSDGPPARGWSHWARGTPAADTLVIDMYPDLSEFDAGELCAVPGMTAGGKQAYLYSAWNKQVVLRHFRWMRDYGLDGVLVQRFVTDIPRRRSTGDVVLKNILEAARKTGRVFAIEYDISGARPDSFQQALRDDWMYLVDELKITAHPGYLRHAGKPVVSVWGMGLHEDKHPPEDAAGARDVIAWFRTGAPARYRVTFMGGTPSRWRTLTGDSRRESDWTEAYRQMDAIQPWTVGRYRNQESADRWKADLLDGDVALTAKNGQIYMPVIFPGFSWYNLKRDSPKNAIPRNGGEFLWRQAYNARMAGAKVLKIAMFDEVNEGTAMFKLASRRQDAPDQGFWLTLDADGETLPSDWYLRLGGAITRLFHGESEPSAKMPDLR